MGVTPTIGSSGCKGCGILPQSVGDSRNTLEAQYRRLDEISLAAFNEQLDGRPLIPLELWDTLQARAELKAGLAAGADGNTSEVYRELALLAVVQVHAYFSRKGQKFFRRRQNHRTGTFCNS